MIPVMIECVPNFSEGRNPHTIVALARVIGHLNGIAVLGFESDADHHRSVITFAGDPEAVLEAAVRATGKAAELIDLRHHTGVHPRVGAADVVPFVPLDGSTLEDCVAIAHRAGEEIWQRFRVPVYFYEAAAKCRSASDWNTSVALDSTAGRPISAISPSIPPPAP